MTSPVHMMIGTDGNPIEGIIRDMKAFTSRHIRKELEQSSGESRKEWMLQKFYRAGIKKADNKDFQFWIAGSHPVQLSTPEMTLQRLNYVHNNPVEAGFVCEPQHWNWRSAHEYYGGTQGLIELVMLV